jgi:hypothetical protein
MTNTLDTIVQGIKDIPKPQLYAWLGIVIGFLLSEASKLMWSILSRRRKAKGVRRIIQYEIEHDLGLLDQFWKRILATPTPPGSEYPVKCNQFVTLPFPAFRDQALTSNSAGLANMISRKTIEKIFTFYAGLSALRDLRTIVQATKDQETENWRVASKGTHTVHFTSKDPDWNLPASPLSEQAKDLWKQTENIVEPLLQKGNPLK